MLDLTSWFAKEPSIFRGFYMIDREPPQQEVQPLNLNVIRQSNPMLFSPSKYTAALLCFCFPSGVKPCLELGEYSMAANRLGYLLMRRFNNLKKIVIFPIRFAFSSSTASRYLCHWCSSFAYNCKIHKGLINSVNGKVWRKRFTFFFL